MGSTSAAASLVLLTSLAGCSGSDEGNSLALPDFDIGPPAVTADVFGYVLDDLQAPYWNAEVSIIRSSTGEALATSRSDHDGSFALESVPTGLYDVVARAEGYQNATYLLPVTSDVDVRNIFLTLIPAAGGEFAAFVVNQTRHIVSGHGWKLAAECSGSGPARTCGSEYGTTYGPACLSSSTLSDEDRCLHASAHLFLRGDSWHTIVTEAVWTKYGEVPLGTIFLPRRQVSLYLEVNAPGTPIGAVGEGLDDPGRWWKVDDAAPIQLRVDRVESDARGLTACCDWTWRAASGWCDNGRCENGPDVGTSMEHTMTVYQSVFFREPAPPDFSAIHNDDFQECRPPQCGGL